MNDPDLGRFIWADVTRRGKPVGEHCAIVLTTKAEYQATGEIKAVVISSNSHLSPPDQMVKIKWTLDRPGGHPSSGLAKESWAICDWIEKIDPAKIRRYCGLIWGKDLEEVLTCVEYTRKKLSTQS